MQRSFASLSPFGILKINKEIDWPKIEVELNGADDEMALHWMKAFWSGDLPADSKAIATLWKIDCKIKEAIVCALAESTFANYVLDVRYRTPRH